MPGYKVIGVGGEHMWQPFFALHCHTMGIPDAQMLYIEHTPVLDRPPTSDGFPIDATIVAHSQKEFVEGTPVVVWRARADVNGVASELDEGWSSWNTVAMARRGDSREHRYLAHIPAQPVGTVIQYYLRARDASGRDETHPYIGAAQAHTFKVTRLGASISAVSAQRGAAAAIYINAGVANARQPYRLKYSLATDSEAFERPDATLPETAVFTDFDGVLDDFGIATAEMTIAEPLENDWVGTSIDVSLQIADRPEAVPDTVRIRILD
jgi:hypothetical protein